MQDELFFGNFDAQVKEFLARFASIPDLLDLDHLTVSGDVTFGRGVSLKVFILKFCFVKCGIPNRPQLKNCV